MNLMISMKSLGTFIISGLLTYIHKEKEDLSNKLVDLTKAKVKF